MIYFNLCVVIAQLCPTLCDPMNVARQTSLSMEFSRKEYWSGLPFPSPPQGQWSDSVLVGTDGTSEQVGEARSKPSDLSFMQ